ncbi:MAG: phospholipase A [Pseudomonadota bacterium]
MSAKSRETKVSMLRQVVAGVFCDVRFVLLAGVSLFVQAASVDVNDCLSIKEDSARLACYDAIAGRLAPNSETQTTQPAASNNQTPTPQLAEAPPENVNNAVSPLSKRWELDDADKTGIFAIRPYQPIYLMPLHYTYSINTRPTSPAPDHSVILPRDYGKAEVKYQLSFKTKILERVLFDRADLWFGYTQQSLWQVYNKKQSSPFRETNYEPELMLVMPTKYRLFGLEGRLLSAGVKHQSNGQSEPRSRSWNRFYTQVGFERDGFVLLLEPWWRIPEHNHDDNPDITDYIGRGKILASYQSNGNQWTLQVKNNFKSTDNRGSVQLNWSYPLVSGLRGYLEFFSGYGESLIDYNHRQRTFGLGVLLVDWM